jgi:ribonuclease VapC
MTQIMDASAVLAILNQEAGGDVAARFLDGAAMSQVNAIEVGSKLIDGGMTFDAAWEALELLDIPLVDLDLELGRSATALRPQTKHKGLSLADRACLALAIREGATAITADRQWSGLDVGCKIELIR